MKKLVAVMLALTLFLAIGAMTSMAYPAAEAENIANFDIQDDGSVLVTVSKENIEEATGYTLTGNVYITIYSEDPGFNAESDMMTPFNAAQAGVNNVGRQEDFTYKVNVGDNTATQSGEYPFQEGNTYYFIFCLNVTDASAGWVWFPEAVTFTYKTKGNYPSYAGDWGITAEVQEDGSVIINADKAKIDASAEGINALGTMYVTIYAEDPNFTKVSDMLGNGNEPYGKAQAGPNNAGRLDNF